MNRKPEYGVDLFARWCIPVVLLVVLLEQCRSIDVDRSLSSRIAALEAAQEQK